MSRRGKTLTRTSIIVFMFLFILLNFPVTGVILNSQVERVSIDGGAITSNLANRVMVLVDKSVYEGIKNELDRFSTDLSKEGWICEIYPKKIGCPGWDDPEDVKKFIVSHSSDLAGCILVGNIPMPEYRVEKGYMNQPETFPCDFYYMDLDGKWEVYDKGGNSFGYYYTVFCNHTNGNGSKAPEIWVGRISPSSWIGDNVSLLKEYFKRNHAYRTGSLCRASRALLYIDDDWAKYGSEYKRYLENIYKSSLITVINDPEKTREKNYLNNIKKEKYEWICLHAHSSQLQHNFYYSDHTKWDSLTSWELRKNYKSAFFYDLHCCEALDYFQEECIGNLYLFGNTSGLTVIGSSKVGGMIDNGKTFYEKLKSAACIGDAFGEWYSLKGVKYPSYCYGMMVLGDPTLKPKKDEKPPSVEITFPKKGYLYIFGREICPLSTGKTILIGSCILVVEADDINDIGRVDFYVNEELRFTLKSQPYQLDLKNYSTGWYEIRVVAFDKFGNSNDDHIRLLLINF